MKKLLLSALSMLSTATFAQKANQGNITSELGVSLSTSGSTINSFGLNFRYFKRSNMALTTGISGSYSRTEENYTQFADGSGDRGQYISINHNMDFSVGVQKHFPGTKRLSPFIGAEVFSVFSGFKNKGDDGDANRYRSSYSYSDKLTTRRPGIRAVFGFDYWITQGLYVGAIYQPISLSNLIESDVTATTVQNGVTSTNFYPGGRTLNLNTGSRVGSIRVGWVF